MKRNLYMFAWSKKNKQMESGLVEFYPQLYFSFKMRVRLNIDRNILIFAIIITEEEAAILKQEINEGNPNIYQHLVELGAVQI